MQAMNEMVKTLRVRRILFNAQQTKNNMHDECVKL